MSPSNSGQRRAPAKKAAPSRGRGGGKVSKRPQGVGGWLRWSLKWGLISLLGLFVLGVVVGFVAYSRTEIPNPNKSFQTQTSYIYYANGKSRVGQFAEQNRESIPYAEMPDCIKEGVVAAENQTFWTDKGIDPKGIVRAAFSNAKGGGTKQGASTITQQYVKILYLTQERTYKRKIKEAFLSLKLQRTQSKQQILEGYLNTIYFGRSAYGIQAAAHAYFNKPAKKLDVPECAVLASVLNNPYRLDPGNDESFAEPLLQRYRYVLNGMADSGAITEAEAAEYGQALPHFPKVRTQSSNGGQRGHMLKLVRDELHRLGFSDEEIDGGGLRVTTTFTKEAMDAAEQAVKEARPTESPSGKSLSDKHLHVGVASVQPGTGALVGFYGGQDFLKSQINWAANGGMVGSTMKPFTLAAALEAGFSLKDTFEGNSPYVFPDGHKVHNEGEQSGQANGHSYGSAIDAIYSMEQSVNTAFVDMTHSLPGGPKEVYEMALKMGVPPPKAEQGYPGIPATSSDLDASDALITLGKARISPINLANAYATIAAGGKRANVHVINKVVDRSGVTRYQYKNRTQQVVDEDIAADVSYAMQQVVKAGTGRRAQALGRPAAGKTGTATKEDGMGGSYVSSSWFAGFTPQLSTAVMYVRGDGDDPIDRATVQDHTDWMPSYFGADYPTSTWLATMERALEGKPVESFPPPAYVDGDAPESGHNPTPPPKPKPSKTPKPKPSKTPKPKPTPSVAPTPSTEPSPTGNPNTPGPECTDPDPANCTPSPDPTAPTAQGGAHWPPGRTDGH